MKRDYDRGAGKGRWRAARACTVSGPVAMIAQPLWLHHRRIFVAVSSSAAGALP
jgi:hypothetical protein